MITAFGKCFRIKHFPVPSPSTAAMFCLGRAANGWIEWKDKEGNTLDSVYRKQLEI